MAKQHGTVPKPHFLTIGYQVYESRRRGMEYRYRSRQVPFLRLSGDWLSAAGFTVGHRARVQVTDQGIMIVPED